MLNDYTTANAVAKLMEEFHIHRSFFSDVEFDGLVARVRTEHNWANARGYIEGLKLKKSRDLDFAIVCMVVGQHISNMEIEYDSAFKIAVEVEQEWYKPVFFGDVRYSYISDFAYNYLQKHYPKK